MLTDKEIIEGNEAISIFMELDRNIYHYPPIGGSAVFFRDLKYHSSFDWIMPVVEKIENLKNGNSYLYSFNMGRDFCTIETNDLYMKTITTASVSGSKIMSVWQAVVQFIKWYNINSTTKQEEK